MSLFKRNKINFPVIIQENDFFLLIFINFLQIITFSTRKKIKMNEKYYRPLIVSLSLVDQSKYLPLKYNYSIQDIQSIKKYLPKNLFKLHGIDQQSQALSVKDQQVMQKSKLKIKAKKGILTQTKEQVNFYPKNQIKMLEWYNKCINLKIPFNPKDSKDKIQSHLFEYISFYLQNCMFFKDNLTEQLYKNTQIQSIQLSGEKVSHQTDIVFMQYEFKPEPDQSSIRQISIKVPIFLCISMQQSYNLRNLKQIIKTDLFHSLQILIKHNFNTRVMIFGEEQKQFICLNSFCIEQNAQNQEEKLKDILGQKKKEIMSQQQIQETSKKDKKFLIGFLVLLIVIYVVLKIFPINQRERSFNNPNSYFSNSNLESNTEEIY